MARIYSTEHGELKKLNFQMSLCPYTVFPSTFLVAICFFSLEGACIVYEASENKLMLTSVDPCRVLACLKVAQLTLLFCQSHQ